MYPVFQYQVEREHDKSTETSVDTNFELIMCDNYLLQNHFGVLHLLIIISIVFFLFMHMFKIGNSEMRSIFR